MAMHHRPELPTNAELATHETTAYAQGELFSRLKLQPLPLYKFGPEDERAWQISTPATPVLH